MAHTDKDRPWWVIIHQENPIEHDHRSGKCVIETIEDARKYSAGKIGRAHV